MKKAFPAIIAACLIGWVAAAADSSSSVLQFRTIIDAPTNDSEQMSLTNKTGTVEIYSVQKVVLLDQSAVKSARAMTDKLDHPIIAITFTDEGRKRFAEITRQNLHKRLAIVVAGRLCCAPVIQDEISGSAAMISGNFSMQESRDLAKMINDAVKK